MWSIWSVRRSPWSSTIILFRKTLLPTRTTLVSSRGLPPVSSRTWLLMNTVMNPWRTLSFVFAGCSFQTMALNTTRPARHCTIWTARRLVTLRMPRRGSGTPYKKIRRSTSNTCSVWMTAGIPPPNRNNAAIWIPKRSAV